MQPSIKRVGIAALSAILVACGGGGGDSQPANNNSYPLQSAYKALVASGHSANFNVSGTCSGTASSTTSAPSASTFEGSAALAATFTFTASFTNCTPSSVATTGTDYYDTNYNPLGDSIPSQEYAVFQLPTAPLPTSVKIGDTASFGSVTVYADSTKATRTGTRNLSYVIERDGSSGSTAIANLIAKAYNTSSQLLYTQQSRYRMTTGGGLTPVSIDVQYSTTSNTHLVYTAK